MGVTLWVFRPSLIQRTVVPSSMAKSAGLKVLSRMWMVTVLCTVATRSTAGSTRAGRDTAREPDGGERRHQERERARATDHCAGGSKPRASSTSVRTPNPVPPLVR